MGGPNLTLLPKTAYKIPRKYFLIVTWKLDFTLILPILQNTTALRFFFAIFNIFATGVFCFHPDLHGSKLSRGMQRSLPQKVPPNLC
jgi:hypothetical protein